MGCSEDLNYNDHCITSVGDITLTARRRRNTSTGIPRIHFDSTLVHVKQIMERLLKSQSNRYNFCLNFRLQFDCAHSDENVSCNFLIAYLSTKYIVYGYIILFECGGRRKKDPAHQRLPLPRRSNTPLYAENIYM